MALSKGKTRSVGWPCWGRATQSEESQHKKGEGGGKRKIGPKKAKSKTQPRPVSAEKTSGDRETENMGQGGGGPPTHGNKND